MIERAARRLILHVFGKPCARHHGLQVVPEKETLSCAGLSVEVHNPTLEALIDEPAVVWVKGRQAGGKPPELEVQQRQQCCVPPALRKGVFQTNGREKCATEVHPEPLPFVGGVSSNEIYCFASKFWVGRCRCTGQ